jgi:fidgetin-like protein 1
VKALFSLAKALSPSIIFVDEIDSILSSRTGGDDENESSRRLKTEFLIQWSSLASAAAARANDTSSRVLVLAATNLPWAIDDAARRRFVLRQYIPLPERETRRVQFCSLLSKQHHTLTDEQLEELVGLTEGITIAMLNV